MKSVFVTGTDTDAGKTYVSVLLLHAINNTGLKSIAFKPISAGCEQTSQGLRNEDALHLQAAASHKIPYDEVNPITLLPPIAPHIAAAQAGENIDMQRVADTLQKLHTEEADFLLIEGAGGWRLPTLIPSVSNKIVLSESTQLNNTNEVEFLSDFVAEAKLPVILVVGMKLGCLNHAVLTFEQIKRDNCDIVGWFANQIDPNMSCYTENLASLHALLDAPFLGEVKHGQQSIDLTNDTLSHIFD